MQIDQLSKRVSQKLDVPQDIIEEVFRSQFKFLLEHFKSRDSKAVNCIHLGKFQKNNKYDEFGRPRKHLRRVEESDVQD